MNTQNADQRNLPTLSSRYKRLWVLLVAFLPVAFFGVYLYVMPLIHSPDPFYYKVATPKAHSLILGTSRASQGIKPSVFNESGLDFQGPMLNFAFTEGTSRPGPWYFGAAKRKLDPATKHGLFIIEVSPRSLSVPNHKDNGPDSIEDFSERRFFPSTLSRVDVHPNLEYLFKNYPDHLYTLFADSFAKKERSVLHKDGWLEIRFSPKTEEKLASRIDNKIKTQAKEFSSSHFSQLRLQYLSEFVGYLKEYGRVVVVRLPSSEKYYAMENALAPHFEDDVGRAMAAAGAEYYSFAADWAHYKTNDGNHLQAPYSEKLSRELLSAMKAGPRVTQADTRGSQP
jgi:hypothetical protein